MAGNLRDKFKLFEMFNLNQFHFKFATKTFVRLPKNTQTFGNSLAHAANGNNGHFSRN